MSDSSGERALWRPTTRLTIPLQTGAGFAMSLFMWGAFWMPAAALAATGLLLLVLGHWLLGPTLALVGAFFMGAWWSFPRDVGWRVPVISSSTPRAFVGLPALWGAVGALRWLWARLA
jgi:hypothetical protein